MSTPPVGESNSCVMHKTPRKEQIFRGEPSRGKRGRLSVASSDRQIGSSSAANNGVEHALALGPDERTLA